MKLEWSSPNVTLILEGDEILVMDHLFQTRGKEVLEQEMSHFFMSRVDTVKEEFRVSIMKKLLSDNSLRELILLDERTPPR